MFSQNLLFIESLIHGTRTDRKKKLNSLNSVSAASCVYFKVDFLN